MQEGSRSFGARAPVTVLMPTFNRVRLIGQSIESILNQTRAPAQVIVIDDGSDDATGEVVAAYGDRVQYVRQENAGKSAALNQGLTHVENPFVWVFDDDDIAAPDALQRLLGALEQNPKAAFSYGRCDKFWGDWPATERVLNYAFEGDSKQALYVKLMEDFFIWQGSMLARKEVYDTVGPFDLRFTRSQDYEMALRIARRFEGVAVPFVAFHQRHHQGVRGTRANPVKAAEIEAAWRRYNHLLFREIHASHDLDEFYIPAEEPVEGDRRVLVCLIQRASIMARKGLWDLATADYAAGAEIASRHSYGSLVLQEVMSLRKIFEPGARSIFDERAQAMSVSRSLKGFPREMRREIVANMMFPVTHRIRKSATGSGNRREFQQMFYIIAGLFDPLSLPALLRARAYREEFYKVRVLECG